MTVHRMLLPGFIPVVFLVIVLMIVLVIMITFRARFSVHRVYYTGMVMVGNHVVCRYYCETQQQEERYVLFPDQYEDIYLANIIKNLSGLYILMWNGSATAKIGSLFIVNFPLSPFGSDHH